MKAVIYVLICLSFCSRLIHCSCLSYGHSCWGAHGKRSAYVKSDKLQPAQLDMQQATNPWKYFRFSPNDFNGNIPLERTPPAAERVNFFHYNRKIPAYFKRQHNKQRNVMDLYDDINQRSDKFIENSEIQNKKERNYFNWIVTTPQPDSFEDEQSNDSRMFKFISD